MINQEAIDKQIAELRERIEKLEKYNETLRQTLNDGVIHDQSIMKVDQSMLLERIEKLEKRRND